ncbi:RHS repeat-associated core domain-containing protein, partial [bacterium]|nr:RHS repeat-associated core domain-containing protein [bacterium]
MTASTYHNGGDDILAVYENPLRYRGYYYDRDLGMYYLGSRYYDCKVGRFISPDTPDVLTVTPMYLTDKNLYAYCDNNPVMRVDSNGQFWDYVVDIGFLAWSVVDVVNDPGDWKNWVALAVDVVFAAVPFVPSGVGQIIKVGNKIDNALDVANAINKVDNIQDVAKVTM